MPAYHSSFKETESSVTTICGLALLPFKSKVRGPIHPTQAPEGMDILEEALDLFRANTLFKNFELQGTADRTLIYFTLFISELLNRLSRASNLNKSEAFKQLNLVALSAFPIPGEPNFPLNAMFASPKDRVEADQLRQYLSQARQEMVIRFLDRVYKDGEDQGPSKWWLMFTKRKFMGKSF